jgi:hypothetical protein
MEVKHKWLKTVQIIGIILLFIGILDPLEGSVIIITGSALITLHAFLINDPSRNLFLISLILIMIGVFSMFYLSGLGGFGGDSSLSWWLALLILPYPAGWLITSMILLIRFVKKRKTKSGTGYFEYRHNQ